MEKEPTTAMLRVLRAIRDHGDPFHGVSGRHSGGTANVVFALCPRGLLVPGAQKYVLSDDGRTAVEIAKSPMATRMAGSGEHPRPDGVARLVHA